MKIVIQLIENYLKQEIPTVLISTDNNKYLINVPAGFQRFTKEHRIRLPVGAHYFFTKSTTATISGLTGLLLTLFERGASCNSKLYLDDKFYSYMEELRYKVGMKILPVSYCSWNGTNRRGWNNFEELLKTAYSEDFPGVFANF